MKKTLLCLATFGLILLTSCNQGFLSGLSGSHLPHKVITAQTNGFVSFDNVFYYVDEDNNSNYTEGVDTKLALRDGRLVLPDLLNTTPSNSVKVVRVEKKNGNSRKIYSAYNETGNSIANLVYANNVQAVTNVTAATEVGWYIRTGYGTQASPYAYKTLATVPQSVLKVQTNPAQIAVALNKSTTNGDFDINDINFYLGDIPLALDSNGKLVLPDMTGVVAENNSVPITLTSKSGIAKYSFTSDNSGTKYHHVVFANILTANATTGATQDGWYHRYDAGTTAEPHSYSTALANSTELKITIDKRAPTPPEDDDEDPPTPDEEGEFGITGFMEVPLAIATSSYTDKNIPIKDLTFYMDYNGDSKYTDGTDIPVHYDDTSGKIKLPTFKAGKFTGTPEIKLVAQYKANSRREYVFTLTSSAVDGISYTTGKLGATDGWNTYKSTTYTELTTSTTNLGIRQKSNVISLDLQVTRDPNMKVYWNSITEITDSTAKAKVLDNSIDFTKVDFYLDMDNSGTYTTEDINIEYLNGKLSLVDLYDKVPFGESRKVLVKSKLPNSFRKYSFKRGANARDLVFVNSKSGTLYSGGSIPDSKIDGWYTVDSSNVYSLPTTSTTDLYVTLADKTEVVIANNATTPTLFKPNTHATYKLDSLIGVDFYLDVDGNYGYSAGDIDLEFSIIATGADAGAGYLFVPFQSFMLNSANSYYVADAKWRFIRIKPLGGTTNLELTNGVGTSAFTQTTSNNASSSTGSPYALLFSNLGGKAYTSPAPTPPETYPDYKSQSWASCNNVFFATPGGALFIRKTYNNEVYKFPTDINANP